MAYAWLILVKIPSESFHSKKIQLMKRSRADNENDSYKSLQYILKSCACIAQVRRDRVIRNVRYIKIRVDSSFYTLSSLSLSIDAVDEAIFPWCFARNTRLARLSFPLHKRKTQCPTWCPAGGTRVYFFLLRHRIFSSFPAASCVSKYFVHFQRIIRCGE